MVRAHHPERLTKLQCTRMAEKLATGFKLTRRLPSLVDSAKVNVHVHEVLRIERKLLVLQRPLQNVGRNFRNPRVYISDQSAGAAVYHLCRTFRQPFTWARNAMGEYQYVRSGHSIEMGRNVVDW
jgi:hypothetical protein